jgi:hypothetical protein
MDELILPAFPPMRRQMRTLLWLALLVVGGVTVYGPGMCGGYYGDDYKFFFSPAPPNVLYYFLHRNPHNRFAYRPLEATALVVIQKYCDMETFPIHVAALVMHILLAWLVFGAALRLKLSWFAAAFASAYILISQVNAHAVLSNDTLSQVSGTLLGCVSIWLLYLALASPRGDTLDRIYYWASVVMFFLALFSKETSISFFPMLVLIICLFSKVATSYRRMIKRAALLSLPYAVFVVIYFAARSYVGVSRPSFGPDGYQLSLGSNTLKNTLLLFFGASTPVSSVRVAAAMHNHDFSILSAAVVGSAIIVCLIMVGCWRSENGKTMLVLGSFAILSLFPAILINHVSELYLYNAMPFITLIVGAALARLLWAPLSPVRWGMFVVIILIIFTCHVEAVREKMHLMCNNGERMTRLLDEVVAHVSVVPDGGELLLVNPPGQRVKYSVFLLPDFWVLDYSDHRIRQLANRQDVSIRIVDRSDLPGVGITDKTRLVTIRDEHVITMQNP